MQEANISYTLISSTLILTKDSKGKDWKGKWHYWSVIGMLNFLANSTHSEIAYAVHQYAHFYENQKLSYENAV